MRGTNGGHLHRTMTVAIRAAQYYAPTKYTKIPREINQAPNHKSPSNYFPVFRPYI
ncbi:hypothetical protein I79_004619 [Cricetulus griseus]|uniref:Uncharacterized protein n=1 Tax=Cricetulus griseus TaxID=10029 RepID=G3H313_CRIGR|nr:hypothetical protein I79_004619 [Cricetulus griseus]